MVWGGIMILLGWAIFAIIIGVILGIICAWAEYKKLNFEYHGV